MQQFYKRYLINMFVGFPLALICVIAIAAATGSGGNVSAVIGLIGGIVLLVVSAILAARSST